MGCGTRLGSGWFLKSLSRTAVVKVYGWYAPIYNLLFGRILQAGRVELARLVTNEVPGRLLEIGVGTGLTLPLFPPKSSVCGVDVSVDMLKRAQSMVSGRGLDNVTLVLADAEQLPFPDASFDCVVLPYVLSVTPNPERLLDEARRVCAENGRVLILNHFAGAGIWQMAERLTARLADRVGFRSTMSMEIIDCPRWQIVSVQSVNLFGLSKLVDVRNAP